MRKWPAPQDVCRHAWVGCIVSDSNFGSALTCKEMCDNSGENGLSGQNRGLYQRLCCARRTSTTRNLGRGIPRAPGGLAPTESAWHAAHGRGRCWAQVVQYGRSQDGPNVPDLTHPPRQQAACHQRFSSTPTVRSADRCKRVLRADKLRQCGFLAGQHKQVALAIAGHNQAPVRVR